jgi:hypothetical protein
MAALDDLVVRLSDEVAASEDELRAMFRGLDESDQRRLAAGVLDDAGGGSPGLSDDALDPSNFREKAGLYALGAPERVAKEGVQTAGKSIRYPAYALGGGAGIAGAGYAGQQYFETQETQSVTQNREEQRALLQQLMNDDSLSPEQKQNLLDSALERGLFEDVTTSDDGGSWVDQLIPSFDLFGSPVKTMLLVVVIYMLAKGVAGAMKNSSASSGTMAAAGSGGGGS